MWAKTHHFCPHFGSFTAMEMRAKSGQKWLTKICLDKWLLVSPTSQRGSTQLGGDKLLHSKGTAERMLRSISLIFRTATCPRDVRAW